VDEIDHDGDLDSSCGGLGLDAVDLVVVAVDEAHPLTLVLWVACSASSKTLAITLAASSITLAVTHLALATGAGVWSLFDAITSAGVRSTGVRS
jgi:hypothetical protein